MADHLNSFQPATESPQHEPTGPDTSACHCPPGNTTYLLEIEEGRPVLTHTACGKPPSYQWGDWEDLVTMGPIPVTLAWNKDCDGSQWHGELRCDCDTWAVVTPTTTEQQRAHARNRISSILNAADHWAEPETVDQIIDAILTATNDEPTLGTRRTTWATAEDMQTAADQLRSIAPQLTGRLAPLADPVADWLDETANALAWLAPFRDHEPGFRMWRTATNVTNKILGKDEGQLDPTTADDPVQLRWGHGDVLHGDDDTRTVCLSGPNREPYWLQLDPERAEALRDDLAGPLPAPQDHPGADLFELLLRAGQGPDIARERMYAYAAMVIRQHKALNDDVCPAVRDDAQPDTETVVAYRNRHRPEVLLCREHGKGSIDWGGLVPLTADDLPDGGICTWGRPIGPECGRDVLIDTHAQKPAYDVVYAYIRALGDHMPPDPVHRNAMIWRAVLAALDARPTARSQA